MDEDIQDLEDQDLLEQVGNHSIKKVSKMMSEILSREDWAAMEEAGLNSVMQKCAEHWGHVSFALVEFFFFCFLLLSSISSLLLFWVTCSLENICLELSTLPLKILRSPKLK